MCGEPSSKSASSFFILFQPSNGRDKGLLRDLHDILTWKNFLVAVVAALIGYLLVERLRDGSRYIRRKQ
jgi:hypothetical protein